MSVLVLAAALAARSAVPHAHTRPTAASDDRRKKAVIGASVGGLTGATEIALPSWCLGSQTMHVEPAALESELRLCAEHARPFPYPTCCITVSNGTLRLSAPLLVGHGAHGSHFHVAIVAPDGPVVIDASGVSGGQGAVTVEGISTTAYLAGLTIVGGRATDTAGGSGDGGGIFVANVIDQCTLDHCVLRNNSAKRGGGVCNYGRLDMYDTVLADNYASKSGGGLYNEGECTTTSVTVANNSAGEAGGGVANGAGHANGSSLVLNSSRLAGNAVPSADAIVGGGLRNDGTTLMSATVFEHNSPSALYNAPTALAAYHLPTPLGHYIDGVFKCTLQRCLCDGLACPCAYQRCDTTSYLNVSMTHLEQGAATYDDDCFPPKCQSGFIGDSLSAADQSSSICARPCPQGQWCAAGSIAGTNCSAGYFAPSVGTRKQTDCSPCTMGSYCPAGSSLPLPCPGGVLGNLTRASSAGCAMTCPLGFYCPPQSIAPTACPDGTYGATAGLTNLSACTACEVGTFCAGGKRFRCINATHAWQEVPHVEGYLGVWDGGNQSALRAACARGR